MRVLIATDTYAPQVNGAAAFTQRLAEGLAGRGHDIHVLCPSTGRNDQLVHSVGVVEHRVGSLAWSRHHNLRFCPPARAKRVGGQAVTDIRPDVVHVQGHFSLARPVLRQAAASGIGSVVTNHFMPENIAGHLHIPSALRPLAWRFAYADMRRVFAQADLVTAPTQRAVDVLAERAGISGAQAVSCGIDAGRFAGHRRSRDDGQVRVLFVGRLEKEKRVEDLVDAVTSLPEGSGVVLDVVGDGTMRQAWSRRAERSPHPERVRFRGYLDEAALMQAYVDADIFAMPSIAELQSIATLEALCAGTPVVAADAMALPHLVRHGVNGMLHRPGSVPELAAALTELAGDPLLRHRMSAAGRRIAATHAIDATLDTFEQIYARTAAPTRAHPAQLRLAS